MQINSKLSIENIMGNLSRAGFSPDAQESHRRIIERWHCKSCRRKRAPLVYYGFSDAKNYFAFGVCSVCARAEFFEYISDVFTPALPLILGEPTAAIGAERSEAA